MTRHVTISLLITALGALTLQTAPGFASGSAFTSPRAGITIENRQDFEVSLEISRMDLKGSYWVAIASVKGDDDDRDRVNELYDEGKNRDPEMLELISRWQIDLVWPKFFVPKSPYRGRVFDGGQNPLLGLEPQPMILVVLKVDDALEEDFRSWFRRGAAGEGYPGIEAYRFTEDMVIARSEIFFP